MVREKTERNIDVEEIVNNPNKRQTIRHLYEEIDRKRRRKLFNIATCCIVLAVLFFVIAAKSENAADVARLFGFLFSAISAIYCGRWYEFGQIRGWK